VSFARKLFRSYSAVCALTAAVTFSQCAEKETQPAKETLFLIRDPSETGINFQNTLEYTESLNPYTFRNFYNGGGVGLGDINNDGLTDVFFSGNMVSNKLYLNLGNFKFKDITKQSGLGDLGVWTTGVSMADINADGLLDIYLCKSGPPGGKNRQNELFINNGDNTFKEQAKQYGLDILGLSIHAAFFDYDKDGDLDCYLLNNSMRSVGGFDLRKDQRKNPDPHGGNRLLRNDNSKFVDVSAQAGIYTSAIGFGLGVTIGDVNKDGWQDIYVSNDFFEKDYLYINNKNGSFSESIDTYFEELSMGSMGADMADINNDALPEVFVTEMLPESDARLKTTSQFENWNKHKLNVEMGYGRQFSRNVLQLNNGDGTFSDVSRLAGVHATDWSWGALIFDFDNDGLKDIFVANGIYKDLLNQDYVNFIADPTIIREILGRKRSVIKQLVDSIPSNRIPNYAFQNINGLNFKNITASVGLDVPSHSNGSAYGDLDNDGDLDIVLNNINMPAFVIENRARQMHSDNNFLTVRLIGKSPNTFALGAKVTANAGGKMYYHELSPMRGFMSSVDSRLQFGLAGNRTIDSVIVEWPDGRITQLANVKVNQTLTISQDSATTAKPVINVSGTKPFLQETELSGVAFTHLENDFNDFDRDRLLFNMISNEGPCTCTGDVNNDGLADLYIGGALGQAGTMYEQNASGNFRNTNDKLLEADKASEDTDCVFFDADGDDNLDLYVASGGNEYSSSSPALIDRLYINRGKGVFEKSTQSLPVSSRFESTSTVEASDYDNDGDIDLFVGMRLHPQAYGVPANGYVFSNDGKGKFTDVTRNIASGLLELGMITDAKWIDVNNDSAKDLLVTGEWLGIKLFLNEGGKFQDKSSQYGFDQTNGWYNVLESADFNNDGFSDIVVGNHGLNSRFRATPKEPVNLYINDFDQNGSVEHILTRFDSGVSYPLVLRNDLLAQIPSLKKKLLYFRNYEGKTIEDIFTTEQIQKSIKLVAHDFESAVWINEGGKVFSKRKLPMEAQFSPVYAILPDDFNLDGRMDLLVGGNQYRAKPETGIYAASHGLLMIGDGNGSFTAVPSTVSGIKISGEIRSFSAFPKGKKKFVIVGKNNDKVKVLRY
jgi:enediyne biosynthesis protein E4